MKKSELLETARNNYKKGDLFLSATGNIKIPIKVVGIRLALHEDRFKEIEVLKNYISKEWLKISPKSAIISEKNSNYAAFKQQTESQYNRIEFLESLGCDIVETETGGVIYCAFENKWAKNV